MKLTGLIPMLESDDLKGTLNFYRDRLGFALTGIAPGKKQPYWLSLRRDEVEIMFTDRNAHSAIQLPTFTGVLYCYPDDVDEIWEELKDKVPIAWPIKNFEYGMREFGIRDNNGYILSFGQPVEIRNHG